MHSIAQRLASALEDEGWSVWWDRRIPAGKTFDEVIEEQVAAARCVVVLWSKTSLKSKWVKIEARAGCGAGHSHPGGLDQGHGFAAARLPVRANGVSGRMER